MKNNTGKIRSLLVKGFSVEEICTLTKIDEKEVHEVVKDFDLNDLSQNSNELYSELQKDLAKLVFIETNAAAQPGGKRDSTTILNAIKLQAELQEKKLSLKGITNRLASTENISKDYIYSRDKEIQAEYNKSKDYKQVADHFKIGVTSVIHAIDRAELDLPVELQCLSPSIITESKGMPKDERIKLLQEVKEKGLSRTQVRAILTKYKNGTRN
jgi:DNA-binding transcriptional MerR regulator